MEPGIKSAKDCCSALVKQPFRFQRLHQFCVESAVGAVGLDLERRIGNADATWSTPGLIVMFVMVRFRGAAAGDPRVMQCINWCASRLGAPAAGDGWQNP